MVHQPHRPAGSERCGTARRPESAAGTGPRRDVDDLRREDVGDHARIQHPRQSRRSLRDQVRPAERPRTRHRRRSHRHPAVLGRRLQHARELPGRVRTRPVADRPQSDGAIGTRQAPSDDAR